MFRSDPERRVGEVGDRVKDARMAAARMSVSLTITSPQVCCSLGSLDLRKPELSYLAA